jgi:hypothetical protein
VYVKYKWITYTVPNRQRINLNYHRPISGVYWKAGSYPVNVWDMTGSYLIWTLREKGRRR